jgi:hypothetical protein
MITTKEKLQITSTVHLLCGITTAAQINFKRLKNQYRYWIDNQYPVNKRFVPTEAEFILNKILKR